jgi:branched-chain amino acid transport system ATP-binding protein
MLRVEGLDVAYGAVEVLKGLNIEVPKGQIVTLLGGNGSGKSTTLKAIMGAARSQGGSIRFDGAELRGLPPERIAPLGIAMVPQGRRIFGPLTVRENLRLGAFARHDREGVRHDLDRVLARFPEMGGWLDRRGDALSVGQQQIVAFGRGLMARPKLLLMDEPSAGLAPRLVERLADIIAEIGASGMTILLVEQNVHLALSVASFGYVLRDGRVAMAEPAKSLVGNDEIVRHYLGG